MRALLRQETILSLVARVVAPCAFTPLIYTKELLLHIVLLQPHRGNRTLNEDDDDDEGRMFGN